MEKGNIFLWPLQVTFTFFVSGNPEEIHAALAGAEGRRSRDLCVWGESSGAREGHRNRCAGVNTSIVTLLPQSKTFSFLAFYSFFSLPKSNFAAF